jgi:hypothetical protein
VSTGHLGNSPVMASSSRAAGDSDLTINDDAFP